MPKATSTKNRTALNTVGTDFDSINSRSKASIFSIITSSLSQFTNCEQYHLSRQHQQADQKSPTHKSEIPTKFFSMFCLQIKRQYA